MPAVALLAQQNLVPVDTGKMASDLIKLMSRIPIEVKEVELVEEPRSGSSQPRSVSSQPRSGSSQPRSGSSQPKSGSSQPKSGSSQPRSEGEDEVWLYIQHHCRWAYE